MTWPKYLQQNIPKGETTSFPHLGVNKKSDFESLLAGMFPEDVVIIIFVAMLAETV